MNRRLWLGMCGYFGALLVVLVGKMLLLLTGHAPPLGPFWLLPGGLVLVALGIHVIRSRGDQQPLKYLGAFYILAGLIPNVLSIADALVHGR